MASLVKGLTALCLLLGVVSGQSQGYQLNENYSQEPSFQYSYNWPSGFRFKPGFMIDGTKADFFMKLYKEKKTLYDARAEFERIRENPMNPKRFEELAEKLRWKDISFNFLVLEDSGAGPYDLENQSARCNHFILRDENGNYVYPYMHLDYPGRDSAEVPVELRNPPENEGFWRLFNGDKDKIIRFGQDYGTKRKVFYLIDVKLDRGTEKETEYSFESGGKDVLSYFRLGKNQVYVLVSDNGNDFGVGTLEDLVQRQ